MKTKILGFLAVGLLAGSMAEATPIVVSTVTPYCGISEALGNYLGGSKRPFPALALLLYRRKFCNLSAASRDYSGT